MFTLSIILINHKNGWKYYHLSSMQKFGSTELKLHWNWTEVWSTLDFSATVHCTSVIQFLFSSNRRLMYLSKPRLSRRDLGKHLVHTTVCCPRVNSFTVKKNTQIIKNAKKNRKGCCSKMCSHVFVHWQMCHEACEICTHWPPIWSPQGTQLKTSNTLNKIDYQVNFFLNVSKSFWCHVISYHSQSTPLVLLFQ